MAKKGAKGGASAVSTAREIVRSPAAALRLEHAEGWLTALGRSSRALLVGPTLEAPSQLARRATLTLGASFGWERTTFGRLAGTLAGARLADLDLAPAGRLALEALCARVVHAMEDTLGRFAPIGDRPGLPRALARTLEELRLEGIAPEVLAAREPDVARLLAAYEAELLRARLADRAEVFLVAAEVAREGDHALLGIPTLFLDAEVRHAVERDLVAAIAQRAPRLLATVPLGDARTAGLFEEALGVAPTDLTSPNEGPLARLQRGLFSEAPVDLPLEGQGVSILSAPGESRECVEIARRIQREAERGVPFDHMAVALRAPAQYRAHLVEALRRAEIPAYFARGTVRPDPSGRAFLALLACAAENLAAPRFAEYLSLGESPAADSAGAPPPAAPAAERWVPPDEELVSSAAATLLRESEASESAALDALDASEAQAEATASEQAPVRAGTLRAPRRWEQLLVEAAVLGGVDRWRRRLEGLRHELELELAGIEDADDARALRARRDLDGLAALTAFALPLVETLAALPPRATWRAWLEALSSLASRALRRPERVLAVLGELAPMADTAEVSLTEVRLVLEPRLTELTSRPEGRRFGAVYVASIDDLRGLSFDVVFVPGLAERLFPQKIVEDPLLPDAARGALDARLTDNAQRSLAERLALRVAVGAARARVVLSYPRIDLEAARPRTPSFYALEVLRAAEGRLPGFDELARRAEQEAGARIGWPAPSDAMDAIDDAEHDLALLEQILKRPEADTVGTARYLLGTNAHLARALRFRALRWSAKWSAADGLMVPPARDGNTETQREARAALDAHSLPQRSFSPTALQHFAACPYRFVLQAIFRLAPRQEPAPIEELDPLQKGSLVHEVQFELYTALRKDGLFPLDDAKLPAARRHLDEVLARVAKKYEEELAPAIQEVWDDGIRAIAADLREMLRQTAEDREWTPAYFELAFGPIPAREGRDEKSQDAPVVLDTGLQLRGSIDLIEKNPAGDLRASDYKTGKARAKEGLVIGGGETLQPVMYALALEKLFPGQRVSGGRLWYCTSAGEFTQVTVPLEERAREAATYVTRVVEKGIATGFLPAAPNPDGYGCQYCDYLPVCGPYEMQRTTKVKSQKELEALVTLRRKK